MSSLFNYLNKATVSDGEQRNEARSALLVEFVERILGSGHRFVDESGTEDKNDEHCNKNEAPILPRAEMVRSPQVDDNPLHDFGEIVGVTRVLVESREVESGDDAEIITLQTLFRRKCVFRGLEFEHVPISGGFHEEEEKEESNETPVCKSDVRNGTLCEGDKEDRRREARDQSELEKTDEENVEEIPEEAVGDELAQDVPAVVLIGEDAIGEGVSTLNVQVPRQTISPESHTERHHHNNRSEIRSQRIDPNINDRQNGPETIHLTDIVCNRTVDVAEQRDT